MLKTLLLPRRHPLPPLGFAEEAARAGVTAYAPAGVQPIRVQRVVGSAGKATALGSDFLPVGRGPAQANYRAILHRMQQGDDLPPISVYQLGSRYFVIDGHTRVAAARALGVEFVDAEVTEALPRKNGTASRAYYARRDFERSTGLEDIRLTAPWRYQLLQQHVESYRRDLERSWRRQVSLREAAGVWRRTRYEPALLQISRRQVRSATAGCTAGDVYTDVLKAWGEDRGSGASLQEMLERYDERHGRDLSRLTRTKRSITTLVDAVLPKGISSLTERTGASLVALDVEAELACINGRKMGS